MSKRLERIAPRIPPCRCCGKKLGILDGINQAVRDGIGIHTRCIPTHWSKHDKGINAGRCKEPAKAWKNPSLINKESIDKIPPDLLERILNL